jgi:hypothetical protein
MKTPDIRTASELAGWCAGESYEGGYRPARCIAFDLSVFHPRRWKIAWRVFTGRYDALDWDNVYSGSPTAEELKRMFKG